MHAYRTHTCAELRKGDVGANVREDDVLAAFESDDFLLLEMAYYF